MSSSDPADRAPARSAEYFDLNNFDTFKSGRQYYIIRNPKPELKMQTGDRPARTVVVLGTGRSGTTMTTGTLRLLGEELGDRLNWYLEDHDIRNCLLSVYRSFLFWKIVTLRWRFSRIMRDRHRRWKRWAFKSPDLSVFILMLSGTIPNPYFIIPTRNILETSFGLPDYIRGGWRTAMLSATLTQMLLTVFCLITRRPIMLFSYEHVMKTDPNFFVDILADFLSIELNDTKKRIAIDYINPNRGYARAPGIRGCIDHLTRSGIDGWVVDTREPQRSITVDVRTGDRIIATVRADMERPDVRDAGFHRTGLCGFRARFEEPLADEDLKKVKLTDSDSGESALMP